MCTVQCPYCSESVNPESLELVYTHSESGTPNQNSALLAVCPECFLSRFEYCEDCGNPVHLNHVSQYSYRSICDSCSCDYADCSCCGTTLHVESATFLHGDYYCSDTCVPNDDDDEEDDDDDDEDSLVHSYGHKPGVRFYRSSKEMELAEGVFHGIELEAGWKHDASKDTYAKQVLDVMPPEFIVLKNDSSITDGTGMCDGFEIVSQPADLDYHRQVLRKLCDGAIPGLLSHKAKNAGLGLHISVNKDCLSNHAVAIICAFIGAERNKDWIIKLARRESRWGLITKKDKISDTLHVDEYGNESLKINYNRQEAVNLGNQGYIEFRLFRGTLKYSSLMLCLEFVNCLSRWSMTDVPVEEIQNPYLLLKFAELDPSMYPHLTTFLKENLS